MARTYLVSTAISLLSDLSKGTPLSAIDENIADMVHASMWRAFPWRETITNIAPQSIALVDGQQDYSPPNNMFRLLEANILRTDTTPDQNNELDIADNLSANLVKQSHMSLRAVCLQRSIGLLRLDAAVLVPTGATLFLEGEFQRTPDKITSLSNGLFFDDQYLNVFVEGLRYWLYVKQDDPRAGAATKASSSRIVYSGQLGTFMALLGEMAEAEDFGGNDGYYPSEPWGLGMDSGNTSYGAVFGG